MFNRYLGSQSKGGLAECRYQTDGQSHPYESPEMHSETMSKIFIRHQWSAVQFITIETGVNWFVAMELPPKNKTILCTTSISDVNKDNEYGAAVSEIIVTQQPQLT